jgi:hypothetical protein
MRTSAAALLLLLPLAVPATANAGTLTGKTGQGKGIKVVTYSDGYMKRLNVNWTATCAKASPYNGGSVLTPVAGSITTDGVAIDDTYGDSLGKGLRERVAVHLRGTTAGKGWRGTLSVKITILRKGKRIDTCVVASETWTAGAADPPGPAKHFVGSGRQHRVATLLTGPDGVVTAVRVSWLARCGDGTYFQETTGFVKGLDLATADAVRDAGSYRAAGGSHGERYRVTVRMTGTHNADAAHPEHERWAGTIAATVVATKHGHKTATCTLKRTTWSANVL